MTPGRFTIVSRREGTVAKMVLEPKVGQVVYEPFCPAVVGVIVAVREGQKDYPTQPLYMYQVVDVLWYNEKRGMSRDIKARRLQDFTALVEEHERKAVKFRTVLEAIKKISAVREEIVKRGKS